MADYLIHVRTSPACRVPDAIGLRRLLKCLLRNFGLVAVDVREATTAATEADRAAACEPRTARPIVAGGQDGE